MEKVSDKALPPPDAYDHLAVWRGVGSQTNEFYLEAASYGGRPVYFDVLQPDVFVRPPSSASQSALSLMSWTYLAVVAGALVLAWRNFTLRRSDRRGAFRVASYFFGLGLLLTAIHAHHTSGAAEGGVFEMGLAQAASRALIFWLWYTALEPYVRRLWPQSLISWRRLLDGRWRDPLVGRHLLLGCLFGLALNLAHQAHLLAPRWLGHPMRQFQSSPGWTLDGLGGLCADVLYKQVDAVFFATFFLMSLLLLLFVFRRMLLASIVFLGLFTALSALGSSPPSMIDWLFAGFGMALIYWTLVQCGFLASAVSLLCSNLLMFPLTTHLSLWYAAHGLVALTLVGLIALVGFFNSSERPISRQPDPI